MTTSTAPRTTLVLDRGPVADAACALIVNSTLADHIDITTGEWTVTIDHREGGVPFELWGSGTQALWRLLCAMAYTSESVSLYAVAAHCDARNRRAVTQALEVLFA